MVMMLWGHTAAPITELSRAALDRATQCYSITQFAAVSMATEIDPLTLAAFVGRPRSRSLSRVEATAEVGDFGVVDEPVDHRSGGNLITEHFTPAAEGVCSR